MCGISGLVHWGRHDRGALQDVVDRMDRVVAPRGPDGHGREVIEGADGALAVFAHRRLAILDRSEAGRQPMSDAAGTTWVTFNGEIYNFNALGVQLRDRGVALRSSSDTEVLVESLALDGDLTWSMLRGMFACAVFDRRSGTLTLARDRFGIKPLVWVQPEPDLVLFASTPQALEASGLWRLRASGRGCVQVLAHGSAPVDDAFWEGVHSVPAGTRVVCNRASREARRYWDVAEVWARPRAATSVADAAAKSRCAIEDSVAVHLVSDVPVAVFLSGGLDSAVITAAARQVMSGTLQTVTVTMPGSSLDESAAARATANRWGTVHTEVPLADFDRDRALDGFFAAMAQPSVDGFNTYLVATAARAAGVQVVLSGTGGDELFGGYPSFAEVPRLERLLRRWGPGLRAGTAALARLPIKRASRLAEMARASHRTLEDVWWAYRGVWPEADAARLSGAVVERPSPTRVDGHPFDVIRDLEFRHFLQRQLLPDADAFTMCGALELRVPFVDHHVVETVADAGRWPRVGGATWKAALFGAWPDWCPAETSQSRKQGFVLPMATWLRDALTSPRPTVWRDVASRLRQPQYAAAVAAFVSGRAHWTRLWALYVIDRMTEGRR